MKNIEEKWLPIKGFEDRYLVSNFGRVKSRQREIYAGKGKRITTPRMIKRSYGEGNTRPFICLRGDNKIKTSESVAKLVAVAFVPNPSNFEYVDLKDGNEENCVASNIKWVRHNPFRNDLRDYDIPNLAVVYENIYRIKRKEGLTNKQLNDLMRISSVNIKMKNNTINLIDLYYFAEALNIDLFELFMTEQQQKQFSNIKNLEEETKTLRNRVSEMEYTIKLQKTLIEKSKII